MANLAARVLPASVRTFGERLKALEDSLAFLRSSTDLVGRAVATTVSRGVQVDDNSETFPNFTWTEFAVTEVSVPNSYTRATVILYASVGGSFTGGGGNVGVCPIIGDFNDDLYWLQGPAISNGTFGAGPVSCSSVAFLDIPQLVGPTLRLSALCQSTDGSGTVIPGSNNVHLSAQIVFGR